MNKKIFGTALIAAMALVTGWNFNQSKNEVELSDLALANAEALTSGEGGYKNCHVSRHLCDWVNQMTYYDHNGSNSI